MTVRVNLTRGQVALIDLADLPLIIEHRWAARRSRGTWYARTNIPRPGCTPRQTKLSMHSLLMAPPSGVSVDHINGDGLDNRRPNLRLATPTGQSRNRGVQSNNTSGFKGVTFHRRSGRWQAQIGRTVYIGLFETPESAARAYDAKARELHGEFARLNFSQAQS